jgi:hypothetical protein
MRKSFRDNGLSIVLLALFAAFLAGQSVAGHRHDNEERAEHGKPPIGYAAYLASPDFLEAVFENWESEFLQMGLFVILTALLFQKGSAESKKLRTPSPARARGLGATLYSHSLSIALLLLFVVSFAGHAISGCHAYNGERVEHGQPAIGVVRYLGTAQFWFESFQNWQSEFLSIAVIVLLSIFLRERGSSQSKKVDAPNSETGV